MPTPERPSLRLFEGVTFSPGEWATLAALIAAATGPDAARVEEVA